MSRRFNKISGQFSARLIEMLESPAYRVLSLSARRVIDRVEIELAHHGGQDNGKLPITFDHFKEYGIHRHAIAPAIREAQALGFVVVTQKGRAGNAEHRSPNLFRLTYRPAKDIHGDGSHEWRRVLTIEDAEKLTKSARNTKVKKTKVQCRETTSLGDGNRHRNGESSVPETITRPEAETITTSISRGGTSKQPASAMRSVAHSSISPEVAQIRIAEWLGSDGWEVLDAIPPDELNRLINLEQMGSLNKTSLDIFRSRYSRGAA